MKPIRPKISISFHCKPAGSRRPYEEPDNDVEFTFEGVSVPIPDFGDLATYEGGEYRDPDHPKPDQYRREQRMRKVESRLFYLFEDKIHVNIVVTDPEPCQTDRIMVPG
jgi:hypothetical protein